MALIVVFSHATIGFAETSPGASKNAPSSSQLQLAQSQGGASEHYKLGIKYLMGLGVEKNSTEAEKWFLKAANLGHVASQTNLGFIYSRMGPKGYDRAIRWYQEAANSGSNVAKYNLGLMYRYGKGVQVDHEKSLQYINESASAGYARAQNGMGHIYRIGLGIGVNLQTAKGWYTQAAFQDYSVAQFNLGRMYLLEFLDAPSEQAIQAAKRWLTAAAEDGHAASQFSLGELFETGIGVELDFSMAWMWYSLAKENGNKTTVRRLAVLEKNMTVAQLNRADKLLGVWRREHKKTVKK